MSTEQQLTPPQARVVASLMEKHLATPNNYPLTHNSLLLACNQKSNREPVMNLTQGELTHMVTELEEQGYVRIELGERADKIFHKGPGIFSVTREEQAVLAMLMLRVPLTLNDIKARTEKMIGFESVDAVKAAVEGLMNRDAPLAILIPKGPGRREDRYTHLLCGEPDMEALQEQAQSTSESKASAKSGKIDELENRISELEARLAELEGKF